MPLAFIAKGYLFTRLNLMCIYIFIFIYLYYVYILFLFALLYSFCFKGKIEKYWRGLSRPKSQAPPTRISGIVPDASGSAAACRLPDLLWGSYRRYKARWLCESINILPTPTKAIVGGFRGIVRGVSLSGIMAERCFAPKLPLLKGKGVHNGYYVHVLGYIIVSLD